MNDDLIRRSDVIKAINLSLEKYGTFCVDEINSIPAINTIDSKRYRWLRDLDFNKPYGVTNSSMDETFNGTELDEVIDRAMKD